MRQSESEATRRQADTARYVRQPQTARHTGRDEPETRGKRSRSAAPMKRGVRILLFFLCAVFLGVFAFSGWKLYSILHAYKVAERQYDSLSERYVAAQPSASPTPIPTDALPTAAAETPVPTPRTEESPIHVDFAQLRSESSEVVGWIYSANTKINYPIVQHPGDNPATADYYYLYRDIHGNYSGSGTPFMDVRCASDFSDYNSVVYGHHMNDGSMFASIGDYRKEGYYAEHPILYLNTPTRNYRIEVFAGYITDADSNSYTIWFPDESSFLLYCQDMKAQSNFASDVTVQPGDKIITLSTCSYEYYDARYVIQGRLVPLDDATNVSAAN